ncbi:SDR family NAD(P)-dependent oxidoreductase [Streptomyces spectabilis]|uniref:SDR family NAD(P)-dependent oxidoreductase n=1 Tax=Streptomyces spectabilis TaxID=68270 RepID=A0A516RIH0_STRST|nr:SDR family NAD(P)-dependent oxidoreductase [Streptomyces spectabilis]QDQ15434.1 SDR family NAD(P)-dependent oxidoreductase [Streptomyces spectabilis]
MANPIAVVTGASSGIGLASARRLASDGFDVVVAARRFDRLETLAKEIGGRAIRLDVTDAQSVAELAESVSECKVLVNNAGCSLGVDRIADLDPEACLRMYEINVLGTIRVTQKLLPALRASGDARIVVITSLTGYQTYPGAAGYASAKYGQVAVADTLRKEMQGTPVQVIEIAPGLVRTEFNLVRFGGDEKKAEEAYGEIQPLSADDVADCVSWAVAKPAGVNVELIKVLPNF